MIPLRILHVVDPDQPTARSGQPSLALWLGQSGHAGAMIQVGGDGPLPATALGRRNSWWSWWRRDRETAVRAAAAWGADLVHAHGEAALATGHELARRISAPLVAEPGALASPNTLRHLREPWVSMVVLPSEAHRARALGDGRLVRDRVAVIPPGIDGIVAQLRPADGSLVIAAAPGDQRAPLMIAQAVASLCRDGLAVTAVLEASDPRMRQCIADAIRRVGLGTEAIRIVADGALEAGDVWVDLDGQDHPLNRIIDALASGRPVVAAATGAMPELVEDGRGGILVPLGDAPALAGALRHLAAADRRTQMSSYGMQTACRFGIGLVGEAILEVYHLVVGGSSASVTSTWRRLSVSRLAPRQAKAAGAGEALEPKRR